MENRRGPNKSEKLNKFKCLHFIALLVHSEVNACFQQNNVCPYTTQETMQFLQSFILPFVGSP